MRAKALTLTFFDWMQAVRLKTILVAALPVLVGTFLQRPLSDVNLLLALSLFLTIAFLQMGTNLINDSIDAVKGADGPDRKGDLRWVARGIAAPQFVRRVALFLFLISFVMALPMLFAGHYLALLFLMLGMVAGYTYTAGSFSAAYKGYGELVVFLFYGWVGTLSAIVLQGGVISKSAFIAASQVGFLAVLPLIINNIRDIAEDEKCDKKTFVVRFGLKAGRYEALVFAMMPYLLQALFFKERALFILFPFTVFYMVKVFKTTPSNAYNKLLAMASLQGFLFSILLVGGR